MMHGTTNIKFKENILQGLPPNWIISFLEVYKELMHCLIVFPFFLKYLTDTEYMISSWPLRRNPHWWSPIIINKLPLLWCLVVNELLARLNEGGVYSQGYADDICLLAVGKFSKTVSGLIQWALNIMEVWCGELCLSVNPDKTGLVAFMRRKLPGFVEPRLFGNTLQRSVSQISGCNPGLTTDLEGTRRC